MSRSHHLSLAIAAAAACSCTTLMPVREPTLVLKRTLEGFDVPECVLVDPRNGALFISNIEAEEGAYWDDDGKGFITRISPKGRVSRRWLNSTRRWPIHSPKGMCVLDDALYFTDNTRLLRCDATTGASPKIVAAGFRKANDLATDGEAVWLSDTLEGQVWRITPTGQRRSIPAPEGVNGLTFHGDRLFAVSWTLHDVYELDPGGTEQPRAFGLASHFTNLDGIEPLPDGSLIVSDFVGNQVCLIGPDHRTVIQLARLQTPADIGLDRTQGLLYVPKFEANQVAVFKLKLP